MKMKHDKKLYVERMVEIEKLKFCNYIDLQNEELEYTKLAIKMPIDEIREFLSIYDTSSPKLDEVKFIINLQNKYLETRKNIIKRIRQVRQITKFEEGLTEAKKYIFEFKKNRYII